MVVGIGSGGSDRTRWDQFGIKNELGLDDREMPRGTETPAVDGECDAGAAALWLSLAEARLGG
jgi:hypothetical protein